jgi:hypothetical protein
MEDIRTYRDQENERGEEDKRVAAEVERDDEDTLPFHIPRD